MYKHRFKGGAFKKKRMKPDVPMVRINIRMTKRLGIKYHSLDFQNVNRKK